MPLPRVTSTRHAYPSGRSVPRSGEFADHATGQGAFDEVRVLLPAWAKAFRYGRSPGDPPTPAWGCMGKCTVTGGVGWLIERVCARPPERPRPQHLCQTRAVSAQNERNG